MSKTVRMVRLSASELATFTGAQGQIIVNTSSWALTVHDGQTPGGFPLLLGANNLSDITNPTLARTNLQLGSAAQSATSAFDAAGAATAAQTAAQTYADTFKLSKALNLSDVASPSAARTSLGLGTAAVANTTAFDASGAASAVQALAVLKANNLSDVVAATARGNLGLGSGAVVNITVSSSAPSGGNNGDVWIT